MSVQSIGISEPHSRGYATALRWHSGMTLLIASSFMMRASAGDAHRIAFSTILMGLELGMLLNFMYTTSTVVDRSPPTRFLTANSVALSIASCRAWTEGGADRAPSRQGGYEGAASSDRSRRRR
jgi:hypothetical protein